MSSVISVLMLTVAKELFQCFEARIHIFSASAGPGPLSTQLRLFMGNPGAWDGRGTHCCHSDLPTPVQASTVHSAQAQG